jgi:Holliday junction resolvase RusA-like endonuclease
MRAVRRNGVLRVVAEAVPAWSRPGTARNGGHRFLPPRVRAWQEGPAEAVRPVRPRRPWRAVRVRPELPDGLRGDPDNYLKTVLDGPVRAGVIVSDRLAVVRDVRVSALGTRRRVVIVVARVGGGR